MSKKEQWVKRECKGLVLEISRRLYRLQKTNVYYVESESSNDIYYFIKFKPDVLEWCTCPDNSLRGGQIKCKHFHAIEFAIRLGTLRDTDRLPTESKVRKVAAPLAKVAITKSYT